MPTWRGFATTAAPDRIERGGAGPSQLAGRPDRPKLRGVKALCTLVWVRHACYTLRSMRRPSRSGARWACRPARTPRPADPGFAGPESGLKITLFLAASRRRLALPAVACRPPLTALSGLLANPAPRPQAPAQAGGSAAQQAEPGIAYEVTIRGLADSEAELETLLRDSSRLIGLQDDLPATVAGVRRRARADLDRFEQALRSEGFYDAKVSFQIEQPTSAGSTGATRRRTRTRRPPTLPRRRAGAGTAGEAGPGAPPQSAESVREPLQVTFDVETGTVYLLAGVDISYSPAIPRDRTGIPRSAEDLDLRPWHARPGPGDPGRPAAVADGAGKPWLSKASVADRQAVIDREATTMRVDWRVDPGPFTRFGPLEVSGLETVEPKYVQSFRTWQPGEVYDRRKVEEMRGALLETGLFNSIQVDRADETDRERTPIEMAFEEREHRSIGFGARYSTSIGPSGTAFWEHRNLLGQDENLRLELDAGLIEQRFTTSARKPRWNRDDQDLLGNFELRHKDTEGFEEYAAETRVSLEREFDDLWTGRLGGSIEALQTTDNEGTREFILFGVPNRAHPRQPGRSARPDRGQPAGAGSHPLPRHRGGDPAVRPGEPRGLHLLRDRRRRPLRARRARPRRVAVRGRDGTGARLQTLLRRRRRLDPRLSRSRRSVRSTATTIRLADVRWSNWGWNCGSRSPTRSGSSRSSTPAKFTTQSTRTLASTSRCATAPALACAITPRSARCAWTWRCRSTRARPTTTNLRSTSPWVRLSRRCDCAVR